MPPRQILQRHGPTGTDRYVDLLRPDRVTRDQRNQERRIQERLQRLERRGA